MDERQKIDWSLQERKLLVLVEKRQVLDKEILAVEELINAYRLMGAYERV